MNIKTDLYLEALFRIPKFMNIESLSLINAFIYNPKH